MEDKIVEIARFYEPEAAQMIESLLKSEGVNCYLRNEYTSRIQYPANVGGIRIELLESEVPRAKGYEFPKEAEEDEQLQAVSGWVRHVPFLRHLPLEKQIIVLFILVAVFLALVIYFGSLVSSN